MKVRTYLDSCLLIAAAQGEEDISKRAFQYLDDPSRTFVSSEYVRLEVIPKPTRHGYSEQVELYEEIFANSEVIEPSTAISKKATDLAIEHDLGTMDALHMSVAIHAGVDEFVTAESPEKPFFLVSEMKSSTIYE